ncbi:NDP-sugar epimerase, includes UDP-GlcNAc-inverting 4,6-dehydratase FlaA1 and capsular polysaccharide biosynthesis protein EpsC [Belliella buryatensis]|uniref:NDP-sugar epimerase, includes UDP-GlcNAc-inverting 4,6-dehydratase FlaA1 and capsular polysaccharide biosynthesis protein EpsC n=2 Tax=Belliella buryatensis TaxID=1500549 RepID=A0A239GXX6_9BACT|nr:NDP-sugar epimerase, includes UDP-GlcNAc-inverting 4,6-dehydratase FlaA1 and capsular polysaccharide biosynthesis protein EpsC [Belliella buryatensis]
MDFLRNLKIMPKGLIAGIDIGILFLSAFLGYLIRLNFEFSYFDFKNNLAGILVFVISGMLVMLWTKCYDGIVRLSGLKDVVIIFKTILFTVILVEAVNLGRVHFLLKENIIPSSVLIITALIALVGLVMYRFLVKELIIFAKTRPLGRENNFKIAMIFGAGEAGIITHEVIKRDSKSNLIIYGFLDDDPKKEGKQIDGKVVHKGLENLSDLVEKHQISEIIIAVQNLPVQRKREITDECLRLNLHVSIVPPVNQWVNGGLEAQAIRDVKIEDLLGRDQISLEKLKVMDELQGKVVLVTGAAGTIGSELSRQIAHYEPKLLILLDQAESPLYDLDQEFKDEGLLTPYKVILSDIRDRKKMNVILRKYRPQVIFHAAAYKHVPMMENYPEESVKCNILGTQILADLAVLTKVEKFVLVSTDKAVNPTNVMGATKRAAEIYVQSLNAFLEQNHKKEYTKFITTRFGNVLGSSGSVIPLFKNQILKGGPVTVTHPDITRYFMTIPEACQLVLEAGAMGNGGEIFVFDMGQPLKILDLAKKMIQLSGKKVDEEIKIVFTGLREGEKLFEELLNDSETVKITHHPKILIAKVHPNNFSKIEAQISMFYKLVENNSENDIVTHLKSIVPEFISNSSRFEILDRLN